MSFIRFLQLLALIGSLSLLPRAFQLGVAEPPAQLYSYREATTNLSRFALGLPVSGYCMDIPTLEVISGIGAATSQSIFEQYLLVSPPPEEQLFHEWFTAARGVGPQKALALASFFTPRQLPCNDHLKLFAPSPSSGRLPDTQLTFPLDNTIATSIK